MKLLRIYLADFLLNNREIQRKISLKIASNSRNSLLALPETASRFTDINP